MQRKFNCYSLLLSPKELRSIESNNYGLMVKKLLIHIRAQELLLLEANAKKTARMSAGEVRLMLEKLMDQIETLEQKVIPK